MLKYKAIKYNDIVYVVDMSNDLTSKDDIMRSHQPYSGTVFIPSSSKLIYDNQVIRHWVNANIYPVVAESCQLTGQFLSDIKKYGIDSKIELIDGKFVVISNLQTLDYQGVRYTYDTNQPFTDYLVYKEINENTRFVKGDEVLEFVSAPNKTDKNYTFQINTENGGEFPEYKYEELHDCYLVVKTEQLESEVVENDKVIQSESFNREFIHKVIELYCLYDSLTHESEDFSYDFIINLVKDNPSLSAFDIANKTIELAKTDKWLESLSVQDKIELYRKYNQ